MPGKNADAKEAGAWILQAYLAEAELFGQWFDIYLV
jgi:hypothetical protein